MKLIQKLKKQQQSLAYYLTLDRKPKALSGGQRQRVALGRASFVMRKYS